MTNDVPFAPPHGGILGIDPGLSGAFCCLAPDGSIQGIGDLPVAGKSIDAANFALVVRSLEPKRAIVEMVSAMPGQGVTSMFRFGQAVGAVQGVLGALAVPVFWVTPGKWKRALGVTADKETARLRAIETWPESAKNFALKKHHGRAEAALIARWALLVSGDA